MKAMVRHKYGSPDVLRLEELQKPTARDDELLIRVRAVSLNLGDWELLTGDPLFIAVLATLFAPGPRYDPVPLSDEGSGSAAPHPTGGGLLKPRHKILGTDIAGRVEAVGKSTESQGNLSPSRRCFWSNTPSCTLGPIDFTDREQEGGLPVGGHEQGRSGSYDRALRNRESRTCCG